MLTRFLITLFSALFPFSALAGQINVKLSVSPAHSGCDKKIVRLIEGQKVRLDVDGPAIAKGLRFTYYMSLDGFQKNRKVRGGIATVKQSRKPEHEFKLDSLRPEFDFANVTFGVNVSDGEGNEGAASVMIPVTREVVFTPNSAESCTQTFEPEVTSAIYDNQNDTDQTISTETGRKTVETSEISHIRGWHFSPEIFLSGIGVSVFQYEKTRQESLERQDEESQVLTVSHTLNPGDAAILYSQNSRIMQGYTVFKMDSCGEEHRAGTVYLEKLYTVTNLYKLPVSTDQSTLEKVIKAKAFGRPVSDTCGAIDHSLSLN